MALNWEQRTQFCFHLSWKGFKPYLPISSNSSCFSLPTGTWVILQQASELTALKRNHLKQVTKLGMTSRVILRCCCPKAVTWGDADSTSVSSHRHTLPWEQHCSSSGHLLLSNNRFLFSILQYLNQRKKHREHWVGALMSASVPCE